MNILDDISHRKYLKALYNMHNIITILERVRCRLRGRGHTCVAIFDTSSCPVLSYYVIVFDHIDYIYINIFIYRTIYYIIDDFRILIVSMFDFVQLPDDK